MDGDAPTSLIIGSSYNLLNIFLAWLIAAANAIANAASFPYHVGLL
jgi:hypothetical protein